MRERAFPEQSPPTTAGPFESVRIPLAGSGEVECTVEHLEAVCLSDPERAC
jgi:hypothetical protein